MYCSVEKCWCFHSLPPLCLHKRKYFDDVEDCQDVCLLPCYTYYDSYLNELDVRELYKERDTFRFFIKEKLWEKRVGVSRCSIEYVLMLIECELDRRGEIVDVYERGEKSGKEKCKEREKRDGGEGMRVVL